MARPSLALVASVALVLLVRGPAGRAEDQPVSIPGFLPSGLYVLELDGAVVEDATLYQAKASSAFLVLAPGLDDGVLVLPRRGCAERVAEADLTRHEDGSIDVSKATVTCDLGPYRLEGGHVLFAVGARAARLKPTPPLVGRHTAASLLRHTPEYARAAKAYQPDAAAVAALRARGRPAQVEVYFGSWCSFCTRFLPGVLRVEQELAGSGIEFVYQGLPPPPAAWMTPEAVRHRVKKLITGIVLVDGREVARIVGNGWIVPEKALVETLR